jgi:integrase
LKDFCRFAFTTSWRKSEVSSLQWVDVDGDEIILRAEAAKNGRARKVFATGPLGELIERRKAARQIERENVVTLCTHIFHLEGVPIADFEKSWWSACVAAGVGAFVCPKCEQSGTARHCQECDVETKFRGKLFHDLRRSAVRLMIRGGTNQHVAMEISGHRTPSMFKRYNVGDDDDLREAMERTQAYIAKPQAERQPTPIRQATGGKN